VNKADVSSPVQELLQTRPEPGRTLAPVMEPEGGDQAVERIRRRLSHDVGADSVSRYFSHQARLQVSGRGLDVTVPTNFVADLIVRRFGDSLRRAAEAELGRVELGRPVEVHFRVDRAAFAGRAAAGHAPRAAALAGTPRSGGPSRASAAPLRYRLEDFLVGDSNRLAHSAAERISEPDGPPAFTLLFVHGLCGLGKTHLLQGAAARFRERHPAVRVRYTTAEDFTNEFVTAVRNGRLDAFRAAYRALDLLCVDDVQFLANKTATQSELLHTFNTVNMGGARIILASDEHPRQISKLGSALVSRFMSGMVVRLDPPEQALRERIVRALARKRGLNLDPAAAACIAEAAGRGPSASIRDLEGALTRVAAMAALLPEYQGSGGDRSIILPIVHKALGLGGPGGDAGGGGWRRPRRPIRVDRIAEEVCRTLQVDVTELMGRGRHKRVVLARALVAHLSRQLTTLSYPEIARAMGRPNHSTIVTACQRFARQLDRDESPHHEACPSAELAGLTFRGLCEQLKQCILRPA
jgi:chromosomal replication initiator protein